MNGPGNTNLAADRRGSYERLRAAHLHQVSAALDDHAERIGWPREPIERHRTLSARRTHASAHPKHESATVWCPRRRHPRLPLRVFEELKRQSRSPARSGDDAAL